MRVLKNDKMTKIVLSLILMLGLVFGCISNQYATEKQVKTEEIKPSIMYNSHIQNIGWEKDFSVKDGNISGTSGKSLRLEAIKIKLGQSSNIGITYKTHIQDIGWQDWKKDGQLSGTSGRSLRLEAIKIKLENSEKYSVMYRVHVQNIGWQDWKTDGELAGTEGKSLRLEAIQIKIVPKVKKGIIYLDTAKNGSTVYSTSTVKVNGWKMSNIKNSKIKVFIDGSSTPIDEKSITYTKRNDVISSIDGYGTAIENPDPGFSFDINVSNMEHGKHTIKIVLYTPNSEVIKEMTSTININKHMHVKYRSNVQNIGWQGWVMDGTTSGTQKRSLRLEAINVSLVNAPDNVKITYQTHIQDIGWQGWKKEGDLAGTSGRNLRLEAIRMKVEGSNQYSIMYRTHVQDIGWQPWCYDGETSGTEGIAKRVEAIEIKIVPKITEKKTNMYIDGPAKEIINESQNISGWIMTNIKDVQLKIFIDNKEINTGSLRRTNRKDVLNAIKGFGDETIYNKTPGFEINVDFSKYSFGIHTIKVQAISENKVIKEVSKKFTIRPKIYYTTGTYGSSGLKIAGDSRGADLKYYQYGSGPNVFFATFAIHGYEDIWAKDGKELVEIANNFYQRLVNSNDYNLADKWTIYIFPGVNQDGLNYGYTQNGPGRTTLYSADPSHKGIDMNRCWQIGSSYKRYTDNRNYNGTAGFQAYEAKALRDFLNSHKSKNGQTLLVDLHGWTQQLIGDSTICSFYNKQFPENDKSSVGRYGTGYLINWARSSLGSSGKVAKSALIELPNKGIYGHQSVVNNNFSNRYISATLDMLRNM